MIKVRFATIEDAQAISDICSEAWKITYSGLYTNDYINKVIADFYNIERIKNECSKSTKDWHGYMVAEKDHQVVGCIGGASDEHTGFIYVLYVKPNQKGKGIGNALLDYLTSYQKQHYNITHQEVYATTGNQMGIPFYESHGFKLLEIVPNWIDESAGTQNRYQRLV